MVNTSSREASERAIEDILARHPDITAEKALGGEWENLRLLERQKTIDLEGDTGRIDLLFAAQKDLLLIELKVEKATTDHVEQLHRYRDHFLSNLIGEEYPEEYDFVSILLAPEIPNDVEQIARSEGLEPLTYNQADVLEAYDQDLFSDAPVFARSPVSTGVSSLYTMNGLIRYVGEQDDAIPVSQCAENHELIATRKGWQKPKHRTKHLVRDAIRLELLTRVKGQQPRGHRKGSIRIKDDDEIFLTPRGLDYLAEMDDEPRVPPLSTGQSDVIIDLLYDQPFYSKVTTGLVLLLDTIADLSRRSIPVHKSNLESWFPVKAGKDWNERSSRDMIQWYGTYLHELGLIQRVDKRFYLTPSGTKLLSHYQIEKGQEMLRAQ